MILVFLLVSFDYNVCQLSLLYDYSIFGESREGRVYVVTLLITIVYYSKFVPVIKIMVFRSVWLLRKKIVYFNKSHKRILTNERKTTTISLCTKT